MNEIPDGLYFGLSEDEYHDDPALGSSDIKALLTSPEHYWANSWMNDRRAEVNTETPAKAKGRAYHKLLLEGRSAFDATYFCPPRPSDYPEALRSSEDLKTACKNMGQKVGGTKAELVERLQAAGYDGLIWEQILDEAVQLAGNRLMLPPDDFDEILTNYRFICANRYAMAALEGGFAEVSCFWTEGDDDDGVRCKARFDKLKVGGFTDLKSFGNPFDDRPERAVDKTAARYRHDLQAAHYLRGFRKAQEFAARGAVHNFDGSPGFIGGLAQVAPSITYVYQQTGGVPLVRVRRFDPKGEIIRTAEQECEMAVNLWRLNAEQHGFDRPWIREQAVGDYGDNAFQWVGQ